MSDEHAGRGPEEPEADEEESRRPSSRSRASPETPPEAVDPAAALESAIEAPPDEGAAAAYHQRARLAEDRLAEVLGAYRKLKADNDGYRERTSRTLERRFEQRHERLLLKFIDILDNLDRALEAAQTSFAGQPLVEGLILVRSQLLQTLHDEGLERIPVLGLPYDPHVSEAVGTEGVEEAEQHHLVVKELMRGYRLNGRIARASKVLVGEYGGGDELPPPFEGGPEQADASAEHDRADDEARSRAAAAIEHEADAVSRGESTRPADEGPSLDEIIARAEAQDPAASKPTPAVAPPQDVLLEEGLLDEVTEELPDVLPDEVWGDEDETGKDEEKDEPGG